jgi:hypothetical protein
MGMVAGWMSPREHLQQVRELSVLPFIGAGHNGIGRMRGWHGERTRRVIIWWCEHPR